MNFFSFCWSEKFFISPSILNDNHDGQSILDWRFFPLSTLYRSCHSLLAWKVSAEISADSLMGVPLYMTLCFSLATFRILFIFKLCYFNYDMSRSGSVWVYFVWDPLCFLNLDICFLLQVWEFFSHISSNTFSTLFSLSSPSGTLIMCMLICLMLSQRSLKTVLIFFFFLLFWLGDFYYSILQITYAFFYIT